MAPVRWPPVLLLLLSTVGGCRSGRSADVVGESAAPSFGEATRRIKKELGTSGLLTNPDPVGFFFCLSLVFVGVGPTEFLGMLVYQLGRSGWFLDPTYSGGMHPLLGVLYTSVLGLMLF